MEDLSSLYAPIAAAWWCFELQRLPRNEPRAKGEDSSSTGLRLT